LQADEARPEGLGEDLRYLRHAHAGLPLEEERPSELEREVGRGRQAGVGHVAAGAEEDDGLVDAEGEIHPAQAAAATARLAITPTMWARKSALASPSLFRPAAPTWMPSSASGAHRLASAASMSATRNTLGPAPLTATRTPCAVLATITPTTAYLDARWANFM